MIQGKDDPGTMSSDLPANLEGKIGDSTVQGLAPAPIDSSGTLDEPVTETIMRDLRQIGTKIKYVLIPHNTQGLTELRNWDLWGPLLLCMLLATTLSLSSTDSQRAIKFAAVFVIVWCGAGIVTINAALLGGKISFFQSVCVLGYCLCPLNIASLLLLISMYFVIKFLIVAACTIWAARASVGFMAQLVQEDRRLLAVYPVVLFYTILSWMILLQ